MKRMTIVSSVLWGLLFLSKEIPRLFPNPPLTALYRVENPLRRPGSTQPPKVCMLSLPGGEIGGNCRPSSLKARVLFVADGAPKSVNVIKRCECC